MRFFVSSKDITTDTVTITGDDCVHLGVSLRSRPGDKITVCDEQMREYTCEIVSITPESVTAKIIDMNIAAAEPCVRIHLYQSLAKGDKLDLIIQKATEIGVHDITLVNSKRCIVKYDGKDAVKKVERFSKIAESAAKQSGRGIIPQIYPPVDIKTALSKAEGQKLFCYELEKGLSLKEAVKDRRFDEISVFVGPEGGYTSEEAEEAEKSGALSVTLGKRILRCETAPLFVLSCLMYEFDL